MVNLNDYRIYGFIIFFVCRCMFIFVLSQNYVKGMCRAFLDINTYILKNMEQKSQETVEEFDMEFYQKGRVTKVITYNQNKDNLNLHLPKSCIKRTKEKKLASPKYDNEQPSCLTLLFSSQIFLFLCRS